ncbi:hypothetical protein [Gimesia algae]|uniref:Uncharacterized protein n=1 Tax=Gimesia algae TaxID=2527971 RepID=A0A517VMV2_9PLAN|nr:hypothetical protein [Gimesia algae]QDT94305.1 hypothetical protein Pan161_60000 [Gimesia algae]
MSLETQIQNANRACDEFNKTYSVGTRVKYWKKKRSGEPDGEAVTRSTASIISACACVWLEGVQCGIRLANIEPVIPDQQPFEWVEGNELATGSDDGRELCWELLPQGEPFSLERLIRVRVVNRWKPDQELRSTRYFFDEALANEYLEDVEQDANRYVDSVQRYRVTEAAVYRKPRTVKP